MKNKKMMPMIALAIIIILFVFLVIGLSLNPRDVPSPLIGKPAPTFALPDLVNEKETFSNQDIADKISLINVWATWCPSCRAEHEVLNRISKTGKVNLYGIDWKDDPQKARQWLSILGNPYIKSGNDANGDVGIDFGVYGAPETYLIDKQGNIAYKHTGPVSWQDWQDKILPRIEKLNDY